ncbi:zf-RING 2 domain containing protein [Asbolus verrucosus]|uniref:RING-type E3 ubiquitin transferase n=1 Tax=Asbolus verrucosus TaxID=1661398 RepID=A0A482W205_ASBVE|nr:zf-RING 2 domain containing protein [Asbolus verrucosus]
MAPRRVKVNKLDYKKLTANDVICPVCRSILIKPITLPCSHGFCASCFETTTQNANLVCPLCRVRIGSWLRSATKSKKLINETLWQAIQSLFPLQVRNKLKGIDGNFDDKYKAANDNKREVLTKVAEKSSSNIKLKPGKKLESKPSSIPSTSTAVLTKTAGLVNSISKSHNQTLEKNGKSVLLNNFATKEYTCRILCQNLNTKDTQQVTNESLSQIQKKNKRIQKITESESDRSNSIESECLYFKPIDYRHNPPSEGLAPIKVPTRKPNVNANVKILAPCGQNQINMNYLESAFARLFSPAEEKGAISGKRKHDKSECKSKKKLKNSHKSTDGQQLESKSEGTVALADVCDSSVDSFHFSISNSNNNIKKCTNSLLNDENIKRSLQEKADFEFATKLQQTFNQSAKYSTRSAVLKRAAAKKQVNIEEIITPYKVN